MDFESQGSKVKPLSRLFKRGFYETRRKRRQIFAGRRSKIDIPPESDCVLGLSPAVDGVAVAVVAFPVNITAQLGGEFC